MDPTAVESRHSSLRCAWVVVLDEAVVETLALELRLIDQLFGESVSEDLKTAQSVLLRK